MQVPLPPLDITVGFLPFASIALAMIAITVFVLAMLVPRDRRPIPLTTMIIGLAALGGGSILLLALLFIFVDPNGTTAWTWVLVAFNFMMMFPAGLWFVSLIVYRDRKVDWHSWLWPASLALVVVGSEVMMGILFAVGGGDAPGTAAGWLGLGLSSIWFDWSMATIMLALLAWLPLQGVPRATLTALTVAAFLAPWVVAAPLVGAVGMGLLMTVTFLWFYRYLDARPSVRSSDLWFVFGLAAAFSLMVAAQGAVVAMPGSDLAAAGFGAVMALVMTGEVAFVVRHSEDSYYTDIKRVQVGTPSGAL